ENRSFDHYYGTMRGVRGFSDHAAVRMTSGRSVFAQLDPTRTDGGYLLPFHVDTTKVDGQDLGDLDHSWDGTHLAWDGGEYDRWVAAKTELTMSYFTHQDVPFHRALADAFTVCDNYFCSVQGPTTPNRLYLWSGMIDPNAHGGGPVIQNPADYEPVLSWTTYPERLQAAGISWQVYANDEVGDDGAHPFVGDYGDNPLWLFKAYHDALASTDPKARQLAARANVHDGWKADSGQGKDVDHVLAPFIADCKAARLPKVSWIVAPYGYSEHPAARPVDGAAYTARILEALWSDSKLWKSTVLFADFDENDGFFDHVVPPVAPIGTPDEYVLGRPIGLGPRVPMTVISPWSRGGYVNSQVFDHTSVLRFLERWTGVHEPNISAWRRALCGDLTNCFDFGQQTTAIPMLPDTAKLRASADRTETQLPAAAPPAAGAQVVAIQEAGSSPARPLPYQPSASGQVKASGTLLALSLSNCGSQALQLAVYAYHLVAVLPSRYDIAPSQKRTVEVATLAGSYDVAVHGPNGFLHTLKGDAKSNGTGVEAAVSFSGPAAAPALRLEFTNAGAAKRTFQVANRFGPTSKVTVLPGRTHDLLFRPLEQDHGWYDLTVTVDGLETFGRSYAGHLENGRPSRTG
ncbi:MAG: phospholipase, partial [Mycobacterium sp.]|nr:phospholipase [Mycobacterium sp.]